MKIIEKKFRLSEDVCVLLQKKKIVSRRSMSSIVDEVLREYLNNTVYSNVQQIVNKADTIINKKGE